MGFIVVALAVKHVIVKSINPLGRRKCVNYEKFHSAPEVRVPPRRGNGHQIDRLQLLLPPPLPVPGRFIGLDRVIPL